MVKALFPFLSYEVPNAVFFLFFFLFFFFFFFFLFVCLLFFFFSQVGHIRIFFSQVGHIRIFFSQVGHIRIFFSQVGHIRIGDKDYKIEPKTNVAKLVTKVKHVVYRVDKTQRDQDYKGDAKDFTIGNITTFQPFMLTICFDSYSVHFVLLEISLKDKSKTFGRQHLQFDALCASVSNSLNSEFP